MTSSQQTGNQKKRGPLTRASHWFQRRMNVRTNEKIRRKAGKVMGMDMLILHTVGRHSGQPRESPLTWFADGDDARLIVASGGGSRHPDWYFNLMAHPDKAAIEFHGQSAVPATPHVLEGAEREKAWQRITEAQPRYAKYQKKSERRYPVIRLTPR
ncbi:nitroreductase family deazaflavin-dependent oxidoreductase [Prauserella endophytica]|uniref:Nitroreductase family deazaflavin-dependent oxidoreductase n=1 Tax=Prauserella endophytica TaxID=1592324 RepID=A0ABY2SA38_9PSEU|nr:nitroreductase family deazaflavin-dependent oxidoreductase [Prauserella endophytica]PXY29050.1 nitroreductase [Prauserella coralliicola]TKG72742.1 nitroreductase family deazaflavin-dependent oxidoreductase [Prauserella endophytica]